MPLSKLSNPRPLRSFPTSKTYLFGENHKVIKEDRVASVQTISGTGANHLGALFLARYYRPPGLPPHGGVKLYISNPTWANHEPIFANVGISATKYPYYDPKTIALDMKGFSKTLEEAPNHSIFLLHACAHNPTGVDPTPEQWKELAEIFLRKKHFAFFDCAYQGFASGSLDNDAFSVRLFADLNVPMLVCQSYAKNAGLYGERIGCLNLIASTAGDGVGGKARLQSQLSVLSRVEISNPPTFGARIVSKILNDPQLFEEWKRDVKEMADRIIWTRETLYNLLTQKYQTPPLGDSGNWEHIRRQIGMFSFTGLNPEQVAVIVKKGHVYMTGNGRISMAGLNTKNIEYVAECIDKAVRGTF
ncbi:PLP-dependent transferase [Atractiella rhizophila]|nr:PLP-dependent transferase [Atractiella rhizophila]